jgi:tripartite-type tricarboxylate transporter receptor subunit TctC
LLRAFAFAYFACAMGAHAQDYPSKPIRLIVPLAPGGAMDTVARGIAPKLTGVLGQSVVVDNRSGGGGVIGVELATHAPPDGHTLLMMSSTSVIYPAMYAAKYDVVRDLVAITQVTTQPYFLVLHPAVPAKSVAELVAYTKANPAKISFASAGNGSLIHLMTELFKSMSGARMTHVPYRGIGAAYPDLIGGQVQLVFASSISAMPFLQTQRLRAIAVTSTQRAKVLPEVPTVIEAGVPGFIVTQWYGLAAPAGTPRAIVERLNREVNKTLQAPDVIARLSADGAEPMGGTPAQFAAHLKSERDKWAKVIKDTGIRGE